MTISSQASRDASKVERRARAGRPTDEMLRAASLQHMDARQQRLADYADSLQVALAASPTREQTSRLEARLAQARKEVHAASRRRVPRDKTAPATTVAPAAPPS